NIEIFLSHWMPPNDRNHRSGFILHFDAADAVDAAEAAPFRISSVHDSMAFVWDSLMDCKFDWMTFREDCHSCCTSDCTSEGVVAHEPSMVFFKRFKVVLLPWSISLSDSSMLRCAV